jgi:hypothetical protein
MSTSSVVIGEKPKSRRVVRTFTERLLLTDEELARGRDLERRAAQAKFDAEIAAADVENYYDQFTQRDAEAASWERAMAQVRDFWKARGVDIDAKAAPQRRESPTDG